MNRRFTRNRWMALLALIGSMTYQQATGQAISEGFDNIATLPGSGWSLQNLSSPTGTTNWFQGNTAMFNAQNGANSSYIAADQNNTSGTGTISNWLITPNRTLKNGDVITFYTRTTTLSLKPDRLQVRMSTNGTSTNVGATATSVGDFTTQLLEINPSQTLLVYPATFTQYTITLSGMSAPVSGRLAFRYFVTSGGPSGSSSNYIGIDNFVYTPYVCPPFIISPSALPNPGPGTPYSQTLTATGPVGTPAFSITSGSLPTGLTLSSGGTISGTATQSGTFPFVVTVSDATNGCSSSQTYTLTVACPASNVTLAPFSSACSNAGPVTLTGGSPSGGTYSGTGVSGNQFNTSSGTQTITYSVTNSFGCTNTASQTFTVNPAPAISFSPLVPVCTDALPFTLSNATPAGGTFSGTGVNNNVFLPSAGTQTVKYVVTSSAGCTDSATQTVAVKPAPVVSLDSIGTICADTVAINLSGNNPTGGTFSGVNVTGSTFLPNMPGSYVIGYTYTASNGCAASATQVATVVDCTVPTGVKTTTTVVNSNRIECFPNPTTGMLSVRFVQQDAADIFLRVVNIEGKVVLQLAPQKIHGTFETSLDLSRFPKGFYLIQIGGTKTGATQKILLQ